MKSFHSFRLDTLNHCLWHEDLEGWSRYADNADTNVGDWRQTMDAVQSRRKHQRVDCFDCGLGCRNRDGAIHGSCATWSRTIGIGHEKPMPSRASQYAIAAMGHLAIQPVERPTTGEEIATGTKLPLPNPWKRLKRLADVRLIRSYKGTTGGYELRG